MVIRLCSIVPAAAALLACSLSGAMAQEGEFHSEPHSGYRGGISRFEDRGYGDRRDERWRDENAPYDEQPDPARDRQRQQEELRYNRAVQMLQQQRKRNVAGLQQQLNQGRISPEQYNSGIWQQQQQLDAGIAQQQRGPQP